MQACVMVAPAAAAEPAWHELAKWALQFISGLFVLSTFLVTYRSSVTVRAGDLLLKLEETFNKLGAKLRFLEYQGSCYEPVRTILRRTVDDPNSLDEGERKTMGDIDECLRFLYLCTLHTGRKVPIETSRRKGRLRQLLFPSRLPNAYHWYLCQLIDEEGRPELCRYLRTEFPRLTMWLMENKKALERLGAGAVVVKGVRR